MTKSKTKIMTLFTAVILLCLCVGLLTACNNGKTSETYTVTFMVENDGSWQQYGAAQEVEDGKVAMPSNPSKAYYSFVDWYEDKDFTTAYKNEGVAENKTVYARFTAKQADVFINGESQGKQNIIDVVNGSYNPGEGLEFDGWYTNEDCTVKYENTDNASALYARSVAKLVFNNGYENVYEVNVLPGYILKDPADERNIVTVEENGAEVEKLYRDAYIVKFYMDPNVLFYVDEEGKDIEFPYTITKSQTINVEWQSPGLSLAENEGSGNLSCTFFDNHAARYVTTYGENHWKEVKDVIATWPVIRIPDRTYLGEGEEYRLRYVDSIHYCTNLDKASAATTLILADGIKSIKNLSIPANITDFNMPKELKIIQGSFNNIKNENVRLTVPDGVEVIIDSFWCGTVDPAHEQYYDYDNKNIVNMGTMATGYNYDIALPASVKNLSNVPTCFTFAEGSPFYKTESGDIYKNSDKGPILVALNRANYNDYTITVPEGVAGIQVGALFNYYFAWYIELPSTWTFVSYNEDVKNYPFYWYRPIGTTGSSQCRLYDETLADNLVALDPAATKIFNWVNASTANASVNGERFNCNQSFKRFSINRTDIAEGVWEQSFGADYTTDANFGLVCLIGKVAEGKNVPVYINAKNTQINDTMILKDKTVVSGSDLTVDILKSLAGIDGSKKLISAKMFGNDYNYGKVDSALYLDLEYEFNPCGFTYEIVDDHAVITGYNRENDSLAYPAAAELSTGFYLVYIPEEIDGKPVTEIAARAFKDDESISHVFLPANLKKVGDSAFENCANLSTLKFKYGDLEVIGRSAFEDTALTSVALRTDKLTEVGPNAFKIRALAAFRYLDENNMEQASADRLITFSQLKAAYEAQGMTYEGLEAEVGKFYINTSGDQLLRYMGKSTAKQYNYDKSEQVDVDVSDVQLIAIAPSYAIWYSWALGQSGRTEAGLMQSTDVLRYEVMEGSVYYIHFKKTARESNYPLIIGIVSKIHANALSDMNDEFLLAINNVTVKDAEGNESVEARSNIRFYYGQSEALDREDVWTTEDQIKTMDENIFEDGWWEGRTKYVYNEDGTVKLDGEGNKVLNYKLDGEGNVVTDGEGNPVMNDEWQQLADAMAAAWNYARRCFTT